MYVYVCVYVRVRVCVCMCVCLYGWMEMLILYISPSLQSYVLYYPLMCTRRLWAVMWWRCCHLWACAPQHWTSGTSSLTKKKKSELQKSFLHCYFEYFYLVQSIIFSSLFLLLLSTRKVLFVNFLSCKSPFPCLSLPTSVCTISMYHSELSASCHVFISVCQGNDRI